MPIKCFIYCNGSINYVFELSRTFKKRNKLYARLIYLKSVKTRELRTFGVKVDKKYLQITKPPLKLMYAYQMIERRID